MDPRRIAFHVLRDLEEGPAHLETIMGRRLSKVPARERAFASSLVFNVLRNREYLDHLLSAYLDRPPSKLDRPVLAVLRLGAAEAALMSTPDHAVVDSAVELAKATPARRGRKLVNAVLRQLTAGWREVPLPPEGKDPAPRLAVEYSHPVWLVRELLEQWPRKQVEAWLASNQEQPPLTLRVNLDKITRAELAKRLGSKAEQVQTHTLVHEALMLSKPAAPAATLPGFKQGLFSVQDAAAQAMCHLLGVKPGMDVADLCAGAGGKTGHLASLMAGQGRLLAVDPSPGRITALQANLTRLGVKGVEVRQGDARDLVGVTGVLDRVLVDAPCTGLGVVGRRPDVRWRRGPDDPARMAGLQLELASKAADLLKPGGALLYCTCTVTRAENQGVVEALVAQRPELRLEWPRDLSAALMAHIGKDGFFRTFPPKDQADAFFAARLVRGD
ncbi:MAG: 16S rRNA (cytosine(967)-C(5))-methyltransferase RsmB [Desulfarculaceae bacterium]|nr:16S rRNA (cytosine(967)-C(5))-methyltransferase RsmB [Desulfarculaceae bacterium]